MIKEFIEPSCLRASETPSALWKKLLLSAQDFLTHQTSVELGGNTSAKLFNNELSCLASDMPNPLLSFHDRWQPPTAAPNQPATDDSSDDEVDEQQKGWMRHLPLCCTSQSASVTPVSRSC